MLSWIITVENNKQEVIFADSYLSSLEYIPGLFRIARYVDEKLADCSIKVLCPEAKGVIGYTEWQKDAKWLMFEDTMLKKLANAARQAGLNYE